MPSNEKRHEVATKLYEMIVSTNPTWPALMEVMGTHTRGGALMEIVHLIEPEPERRCYPVRVDVPFDRDASPDVVEMHQFKCSECGSLLDLGWNYCTQCGAWVACESA